MNLCIFVQRSALLCQRNGRKAILMMHKPRFGGRGGIMTGASGAVAVVLAALVSP